jgi:hypothetical protein
VVVNGSGSFDLTGLSKFTPGETNLTMEPSIALLGVGVGAFNFDNYQGVVTGPLNFGTG